MTSWVFTPAYCKEKMLRQLLEHLYKHPAALTGFKHVILDQHYPLKNRYEKSIQQLAENFGCIYIDSLYDRGLHRGINHAMRMLDVRADDIFIGCDPDDRPTPGAFQALKEVMQADSSIAVAALNFSVIPWKIKDHGLVMKESVIAGHQVWEHSGVEMWNVAAFNMKLVTELGGFTQPNAYYGGLEIALYRQWIKKKMKLVYLIDENSESASVDRNDPELYDKSYGAWKIAHATQGYVDSFEQYLREKGKV